MTRARCPPGIGLVSLRDTTERPGGLPLSTTTAHRRVIRACRAMEDVGSNPPTSVQTSVD